MTNAYEIAVKKTFIDSLRSVFLVDDAFPSFADMFRKKKDLERFKERDRARRLYSAFRKQHLPCDIENTFNAGDIKMVERMRKCDLIVLDLHLTGDDTDSSLALHILRRLADSEHFNTVVVYTKKEELNQVWLEIAANLRPDLRDVDEVLSRDTALQDWWATADLTGVELPSETALVGYLLGGMDGIPGPERGEAIRRLRDVGAPGRLPILFEALLRREIQRRQAPQNAQLKDGPELRAIQGRCVAGQPYWAQCRGCFVAIVNKVSDERTEADHLMACLKAALLDWKPNFLQVLISEIQNRLELESLAADTRTFSDEIRQVGLSHYLLQALEEHEDEESAIEAVVDRVVDTVRSKFSADLRLRQFARKVLRQRRAALGAGLAVEDRIARAVALAHATRVANPDDVLFFLNSFLSSEPFGRSRITTGTIFMRGDEYWMVMSPACDLTSRPPAQSQRWAKAMHPVRAVLAIRLQPEVLAQALRDATRGRHAFVQIGVDRVALQLLTEHSTPAPEMFFALDAGRVKVDEAGRSRFRAQRVLRAGENHTIRPKLARAAEYVIVGQLRANYASRILQFTGAHLARIGVDFFSPVQDAV
jgi:hypothetical protein